MACHSKGSEGPKVAAVVERDEAEGNNNQQDSFLVNVPAEEEGCVSAERGSSNEVGPCWPEEEFDECRLGKKVSTARVCWCGLGWTCNLGGKSQDERHAWRNVR